MNACLLAGMKKCPNISNEKSNNKAAYLIFHHLKKITSTHVHTEKIGRTAIAIL